MLKHLYIKIVILLFFQTTLVNASTLHGIVISQTNDYTIGEGCQINHKRIKETLTDISKKIDYKLILNELKAKDVSVTNISKLISKIKPDTADIIVFWYSGHGSNVGKNKYPNFLIGGSVTKLNILNIHKELISKKARFVLTVGDCCNLGGKFPEKSNCQAREELFDEVDFKQQIKNANSLFGLQGDILAISSKQGEYSYYNGFLGGFFSYSLLKSITNNVQFENDTLTWTNVSSNSICLTSKMIKSVGKQQNPYLTINITQSQIGNITSTNEETYIVQEEDTGIWQIITKKLNVPREQQPKYYKSLIKLNNLEKNPNYIEVGQILKLPKTKK